MSPLLPGQCELTEDEVNDIIILLSSKAGWYTEKEQHYLMLAKLLKSADRVVLMWEKTR